MNRFVTPQETFSWSYTKFNTWRTCPRKFNEVNQLKNFKEEYTDARRQGDSMHGAFERYVGKNQPLPTGWKHLQSWADDAAKRVHNPHVTHVAKELAITREFKSTGYWAKNVWLRVKLDQLDIFPLGDRTLARIIDFKNGNMKDDSVQLAIYAAVVFAHYPDIVGCRCEYWWVKVMEKTHEIFQPTDMADLWALLLPELQKMEEAQETNNYPPQKNGLCKEYCPVTTCEHNGRK